MAQKTPMSDLSTISSDFNLGDFYAILTALVWSVAIIFFRLAGDHFRAVPLKILQNFVTVIFFGLAVFFFVGFRVPDFSTEEWVRLVASALLGVTLADTTHLATIRRLGASGGALIDTLYLPLIAIMAFIFYGEVLSTQSLLGGLLVLVAIAIGSYEPVRRNLATRVLLTGIAFGIVTQVGHAGTVMLVKDLLAKESILLLSFYRFTIGAVILIVINCFLSQRKEMFAAFCWDKRLLVSLPGAFLGLFLATFLWFLGFKYTLAARAAIYNQMATVFVILLATFLLREQLTKKRALAVALAVVGGLLVAWG